MLKRKINIPNISLSQTIVLTFLALLCFFAGTYFVLGFKGREFHEIEYKPAAILDSILSVYDRQSCPLPEACDTTDKQDTILAEIRYRRSLISRLPDSLMQKLLINNQLFIHKDSFKSICLVRFNYGDSVRSDSMKKAWAGRHFNKSRVWWDYYFNYSLKYNRPIPYYHLQYHVRMRVKNYQENMDFLIRYPGFLLWTLLIIVQYGLFPVLTLCAWVIIIDFKKRFPDIYMKEGNKRLTLKYAILATAILSLFAVSGFYAFFNPNLIRSGLFHRNMNEIMITVSVLTSVVGISCFTGFMLISGTPFKKHIDDHVTHEDTELLNAMNDLFSRLLIICTIVLCIIVLTTGALYNSLNKMEFVKKVTDDLGYSPLGYYYAILFAALCSIIMLLFFIPSKLRLLTIEEKLRKLGSEELHIGQPMDVFGLFKSIFIIGLPLITGLIQSVFSALTK